MKGILLHGSLKMLFAVKVSLSKFARSICVLLLFGQAGLLEKTSAADRLPTGPTIEKVTSDDAREALNDFLGRQEISEKLRRSFRTVVEKNPGDQIWSGRLGDVVFGLAVRRLPDGPARQKAGPAFLRAVDAFSTAHLIETTALLDVYRREGFTNSRALSAAILSATRQLQVDGWSAGLTRQAGYEGGFAIGYAVGNEKDVLASLYQPVAKQLLREHYQRQVHKQLKAFLKRHMCSQAVAQWRHLKSLGLSNIDIDLDVLACLVDLGLQEDCLEVARQSLKSASEEGDEVALEKIGDIFVATEQVEFQEIAKKAFETASHNLLNGG